MLPTKFLKISFPLLLIFVYPMIAVPPSNPSPVVRDPATGLVWKKCTNGLKGYNCEQGTAIKYEWMSALKSCPSPFRLPTVNELKSLVDRTKNTKIVLNTSMFPGTIGSEYWSSTPNAVQGNGAWFVRFSDGASNSVPKSNKYPVRCVSGPELN